MSSEFQLLRNDLLILTRQMLDEAVDEDNGKKLHIGEVLGVLASAIERGRNSVARENSYFVGKTKSRRQKSGSTNLGEMGYKFTLSASESESSAE